MKALIRTIRDLHRRRGREEKGLALAEGVRRGAPAVAPLAERLSRTVQMLEARARS